MYLLTYSIFRFFGFLVGWLPFRTIHFLGKYLGHITYYLHRSFRKKALTNLAIAKDLNLTEKEREKVAKEAFENLAITCLEFFRLKRAKNRIEEVVQVEGPYQEEVFSLMRDPKQGVIFLTGHQANWEIPFLFMTHQFPGIAIGRPIKNPYLYRYVLSVREMFGGKIVMPRQAVKEGLKALKRGEFLGIVGDQAFPGSGYSYPLFGTRAWTTPSPALLAYRTGCPLVTATVRREKGRYFVSASRPLWPNRDNPIKEEVPRLMDEAISYLEASIKRNPGQWLWQHDRWKQAPIDHLKREYRFGFVRIVLPKDPTPYLSLLPVFKKIYPHSFLSICIPKGFENTVPADQFQIKSYTHTKDLYTKDWHTQILFDFCQNSRLRRHYRSLGAFQTLDIRKLKHLSKLSSQDDLQKILTHAIVKKECLKTVIS